jgi:hypothetical protein
MNCAKRSQLCHGSNMTNTIPTRSTKATGARNHLRSVRRLSFTLVTLALLTIATIVTNTNGSRISNAWLARVGFAPDDLWRWEWERLFTSALVTHGQQTFWGAWLIIAGVVGSAEWRTSSRRAAVTFWGVHLVVLLLLSIGLATPLRWLNTEQAKALAVARDVGPSAGYLACLGLLCSTLPRRPRWALSSVIVGGLVVALFLPPAADLTAAVKLSADAAHLLAFPLGIFIGLLTADTAQPEQHLT